MTLSQARGVTLTLGVLCALFGTFCHSASFAHERACSRDAEPLYQEPASVRQEEGQFAHDDATFTRNNGDQFDFLVYSLGKAFSSQPPWPYQLCFRYEILNAGAAAIQELRWPAARIRGISEIVPGKAAIVIAHEYSASNAISERVSSLSAFSGAPASVNAVMSEATFLLPDEWRSGDSSKQSAQWSTIRYLEVGDELDEVLRRYVDIHPNAKFQKADASEIQRIDLPSEPVGYPAVQTEFLYADYRIAITSGVYVYPSDRVGKFEFKVVATAGSDDPAPMVFAPALSALESVESTDNALPERTAKFIDSLMTEPPQLPLTESTYERFLAMSLSNSSETPLLFLVKQPVSVTIGKWSACIIADAYSPVPVTTVRCL